MKFLRKFSALCGILLVCFALHAAITLAASPGAAKATVDPVVRQEVEKALGFLAEQIGRQKSLNNEIVFVMLANHLGMNNHIYGAAFAFAPQRKNGKLTKSSPYIYRDGGQLVRKDLMESYDYADQKWYVAPVQLKKPIWSDPYFDEGGGNAWMVTYSFPVYTGKKNSQLIGVVTSDVLIPK